MFIIVHTFIMGIINIWLAFIAKEILLYKNQSTGSQVVTIAKVRSRYAR